MDTPEHSHLNKEATYVDQYDPSLLFQIPRFSKRTEMGIISHPIFFGADLWTAYELSWLNCKGKPQVALAHILIPAESSYIIESKSFKLYLNSFNNTRFESAEVVKDCISTDINTAIWKKNEQKTGVDVILVTPNMFDVIQLRELDGINIDALEIECTHFQPAPNLLSISIENTSVTETLVSHLLKSNCTVTGQPDWASVQITYTGNQIDHIGLLQYIVSFRNHDELHEQCVERIFMDIWTRCKPTQLTVYARYTRRGGVDINPWRTSTPGALPPNVRTARQ